MGRSTDFRITAALCISLALMILLLPLRWILAWFGATALHEFCHWLAVKFLGGDVAHLQLGLGGAVMDVGGIAGWREMFCALAGPLGALTLLFFARWVPAMAVCAIFQTAYNLLPLYPLDGGRAMKYVLERLAPVHAGKICNAVAWITIGLLSFGAIWAAVVWKLGVVPILLVAVLCLRTILRKTPCNNSTFAVQY